jgi:3,4-dihydroxy 2-butanone 4-phosphate synthase/GTP cyclohydrolase II
MNFDEFKTAFIKRGIALISDDAGSLERAILVAPAQTISAAVINEMLTLGSGVLFVAMSQQRADDFLLTRMSRPQMSQTSSENEDRVLDLCVSVEAREGVTTGISAADRAATVRTLGESHPDAQRLVTPGHVMPVRVRTGGVLVRNSLPEAAVDAVHTMGGTAAAAYVDILDEHGELLNSAGQHVLAEKHRLPSVTLSALIGHRLKHEQLVQRITEARLPTRIAGELRSYVYISSIQGMEHLALVKGDITGDEPVLTRVQAGSTIGDVFGGGECASRHHIEQALNAIGQRGRGVLVYLRRPLKNNLSEQIFSLGGVSDAAIHAQMRDYGLGAQILRDLGVKKVEVLTSSERSYLGLDMFGIEIAAQHLLSDTL